MSVYVFEETDYTTVTAENAAQCLVVEKKKGEDKLYKGSRFLNNYFNIGDKKRKEGWFNVKNIVITRGAADPNNKEDPRNEYDGTRMKLQTSLSHAGAFGRFLDIIEGPWQAQVKALADSGVIVIGTRKYHGLLNRTYGENSKYAGEAIEDPSISFKIDFDPFPAKFPVAFLRGQPQTQFFNYNDSYVDDKGKTQYRPATVTNEKGEKVPVNKDNFHLFITDGCILREGRVYMPSTAISQAWVSCPMTINRAVIEPAPEGGFSDDTAPASQENLRAELVNPADAQTTPSAEPVKEEDSQPALDMTADELAAIIGEI